MTPVGLLQVVQFPVSEIGAPYGARSTFIGVFFKKFGQAAISYSANWTFTQEYFIVPLLISFFGNTLIFFSF